MDLRFESLTGNLPDARRRAVAIGNFDGVHLGHRRLLQACVEAARKEALGATVLTFDPHPASVVSDRGAPARIQTDLSRRRALREIGIEELVQLRFDQRVARLSPSEFIDDVLVEGVSSGCVVVGEGFRFGAGRAGDVAALRQLAHGRFETREVETLLFGGERVSSSKIREALSRGDLAQAERFLGHPYEIEGPVVHGDHRGRTIGFPTANIDTGGVTALGHGVYAADGFIDEESAPRPTAVNFGLRPTVKGTEPRLEAHFPGFDGDLYGKTVRLRFRTRLRGERAFDSLDDLKAQLQKDTQAVLEHRGNRDSLSL